MGGMGGVVPMMMGSGGIPQFMMPGQFNPYTGAVDKNGKAIDGDKSKQGDKKE
jgi:hypothetical protein